jgi:hypothetical protein
VIAAEGRRGNILDARSLGRAKNVFPHFVFVAAKFGFLDRHLSKVFVVIEHVSADRGDDIPTPLQRHGE